MLPSTRKLRLKVVENTKQLGWGALADQEMGSWWSINSSIMSPENKFKCSQKQPKTKIDHGGLVGTRVSPFGLVQASPTFDKRR